MKRTTYIRYGLILMGLTILFASACKKEWEAELAGDPPRIFQPVIKGQLEALGNYVQVAWQESKETTKYKVEVSVDTFKTIAGTVEIADTTAAAIDDLLWEQLYQVRVTAVHPTDPSKNSLPADFGEVKTPRFPTIVEFPETGDIGMTNILFKWRNEGEPVSALKVIKIDAESEEEAEVGGVNLSAEEIQQGFKLVEDLTPSTRYRIELYSGGEYRGANTYTTRAAIAGEVVDLQNDDPASVNLSEVVTDAAEGVTILLKKGATYEITSSLTFVKSVTLMGGIDPLVPEKTKVAITDVSNFNIGTDAHIEKLAFEGLELYTNDGAGKYLFNPSNAGQVDSLLFNDCIIRDVRGVTRYRGGMTIENQIFENCVVYNVSNYGVLTIDDNQSAVHNFTFSNSTLYNADVFIASKNEVSGRYLLTSSTFYQAPMSGRLLIDFSNKLGIVGGVEISNMVFGQAKPSTGNPPTYDILGIRMEPSYQVISSNNYGTSDFVWRENSEAIIPDVALYTKTSMDIFVDPTQRDFTIKDNGFPGNEDAGDPRWRP